MKSHFFPFYSKLSIVTNDVIKCGKLLMMTFVCCYTSYLFYAKDRFFLFLERLLVGPILCIQLYFFADKIRSKKTLCYNSEIYVGSEMYSIGSQIPSMVPSRSLKVNPIVFFFKLMSVSECIVKSVKSTLVCFV
jgi:hypothetical protein